MKLNNDAKRAKEQFIRKVFDYYNGKINKFNNPAVLNIEWDGKLNTAGDYKLPNRVTIRPYVIAEYSKENYMIFNFKVIEVIIHELYHADQVISSDRSKYKNEEDAVEKQTLIYISTHRQEIMKQFGLDIYHVYKNDTFEKAISAIDDKCVYTPRKYTDHLFMIFADCGIYDNNLSEILMNKIIEYNINNSVGSLKIIVNDITLVIQDKRYLFPVSQLNNFFYSKLYNANFNKYDAKCNWSENSIDGWDIVININTVID